MKTGEHLGPSALALPGSVGILVEQVETLTLELMVCDCRTAPG